jgi:hypothetical protein
MAKIKVKLIDRGMIELLKSQPVRAELTNRMVRVAAALKGSSMEARNTRSRVVVKVLRGSDFDEANTGDLSRALDLAGGLRGQFTKNQLAAKRAKRRNRGK